MERPSYLPPGPFHPLLGFRLDESNAAIFKLDDTNEETCRFPSEQSGFRDGIIRLGGYGENRSIYLQHELFHSDGEKRTWHLGVDIWAPPGTQVYAPLDGRIISVTLNAGPGNYGPTIIVQHSGPAGIFHTLYGHLGTSCLSLWKEGQWVERGGKLASIGDWNENGNWPPHLHFQLIRDLEGNSGDYPGVCSEERREHYFSNCPDPNWILECPLLVPQK